MLCCAEDVGISGTPSLTDTVPVYVIIVAGVALLFITVLCKLCGALYMKAAESMPLSLCLYAKLNLQRFENSSVCFELSVDPLYIPFKILLGGTLTLPIIAVLCYSRA